MPPIYYWISHTGDYEGNTGVQRVVRNLAAALVENGQELIAVRWCVEREAIVRAEPGWLEGLARFGGPRLADNAEPGVPLHLAAADAGIRDQAWLLMPEVPHVGGEDGPNLAVALDYARFHGLRSACIFYDLIPLRQPGYEALAGDHARYALALAGADLVLGISQHAISDLHRWWEAEGHDLARLPRTQALLLPEEIRGTPRVTERADAAAPPVRFLALGTVEPRKNQLEAMRAFARLCRRRPDLDMRLDVVGGLHGAIIEAAEAIAGRERRIRLHRYLPDAEVAALTDGAHATVFVSLDEGYGLPIAESLWQGVPCLCSDHGAMAEVAAGGGCLMVKADDGAAIERGFEQLADDSELRGRLGEAACRRDVRTWRDYGAAVMGALAAAPLLERIVVIEGALAADVAVRELSRAGVAVRRLHWRTDSRALLPGSARSPEAPAPGAGQMRDVWAVLPLAATGDAVEAADILASARALGMRVALEAAADTPPELLAAADLALFVTESDRDAALAVALRQLNKTVTLRDRFRVGTGGAAVAAIAGSRARIAAPAVPRRPTRVFYWVGLTVTQPFNTGVQRVTRLLAVALQRLGVDVVPVKWDEAAGAMVHVSTAEAAHLAKWNGPAPGVLAPVAERLDGEWLLLPEITVPLVPPGSDVARYGRSRGMRVAALFYDLIPEKMPEIYPQAALDNMRAYWRTFESVDLALPISWTAAADLGGYLRAQGMRQPAMVPCPLAGDAGAAPRAVRPSAKLAAKAPLRLLAVGTWEPRKNYPRLLRALAEAQRGGKRPIALTIAGRRAGYADLDIEVSRLAAAAGATLLDHVTDDALLTLYRDADATVYASWEEGFGLPVLESLWHGRPCVCHLGSAMAEVSPGGGVLAVDMLDEASIATGLVRLANTPDLLARLGKAAVSRPIRSWDEYADDVLRALSNNAASPGWPLPAIARRRPLLSCSITTYNRARWLTHSLPRLLEATRPWRDVVEVVVCDNTSTDDTPDVVARFQGETNFSAHRNPENVGMLGNLGRTAALSRGAFVWLLGDDDLLIDGAIENVLEGLAAHPDVEMAYMNYACTSFDAPERLADPTDIIAAATEIAPGGPNRRVPELREVAGLNENLFTAIYACAFRRDHALRGYQLDTRGSPFSSLSTCVPSSVYALAALQDRPAWWVGEPALVVNMNVSWLRWALLWHLERMPDLFEEAERRGVNPAQLDPFRLKHLAAVGDWVNVTYFQAEDAIRTNFSLARLLERCKHLPEFTQKHLPAVRRAYQAAWAAGRVVADAVPPDELFARYGLA